MINLLKTINNSKRNYLILLLLLLLLFNPVKGEKQQGPGEEDDEFSVSPKINLKTVNTNITNTEPGIIQLSITNPGGNEDTVVTEIKIPKTEGTEIEGPGIKLENEYYIAQYQTPPRESSDVEIRITSESKGSLLVNPAIKYWPLEEMDDYNQFSKSIIFNVNIEEDNTTGDNNGTGSNQSPGGATEDNGNSNFLISNDPMFILLLLSILGLITASIIFAYKSGQGNSLDADDKIISGGILSLGGSKDSLHIPKSIFTDFMETRAESQFRPGKEDVETIYALSGSDENKVDTKHKFSSGQIVTNSSDSTVDYRAKNIIEHISKKRDSTPEVIVKVHTHPRGTTDPSDKDLKSWKKVAKIIREEWPNTKVLFGVHAFSREFNSPKKRKDPQITGKTQVEWRSLTRDHRFKVYDAKGNSIRMIL